MSLSRTIDEFSTRELEEELARRRRDQTEGRCDYCGRSPDESACKFPERHRGEELVS